MRIVVSGGTGFLGTALTRALATDGNDVVVLTRTPRRATEAGTARDVAWTPDGAAAGDWVREIDGAGAVINLAGAGIADKRWSPARKAMLRSSRLDSTRSLIAAVQAAATPPSVFVQGSAIGYYGPSSGDDTLDELSPPSDDFLGRLANDWEAEARPASAAGSRLVVVRTGIVLGAGGGALRQMKLPFLFFVGGPIASGRQYLSWIHRDDWVRLMCWCVSTPAVSGALNGTAPEPATNADFSRALGRALGRPSWLPVPAFVLRIAIGELADTGIIAGQRVLPTRTESLGFRFTYPTIDEAMGAIFRK